MAPRIDGFIEEVWHTADSAFGFIQALPEAGRPAAESTIAYVLQDEHNLYIAFRCLARDTAAIVARLTGSSDRVFLYLDTYDDNASAYGFAVSPAGVETDFRLTENGAAMQDWNGVWHSAARRYPWGWAAELAIPFKTLRYPKDSRRWGIEFGRHIVRTGERTYYSISEQTTYRVSQMPTLVDIKPPRPSLRLELYPVALGRSEKRAEAYTGWVDSLSAAAGLDLSWQPTTSGNLQLTTFPDFAQIEADPYQVNLSRFELWLSEQRPFFVEAAENFGRLDALTPFYTRRIGRPLPDGRVVPIIAGAKYTDRIGRLSLGALGALTGRTGYQFLGEQLEEPASLFSALSLRRGVLRSSEFGMLYSGKDSRTVSNHGLVADFSLRTQQVSGQFFAAGAQCGESLDWATSASVNYDNDRFFGSAGFGRIQPRFDLNGPGFVTWRGQTFWLGGGPQWYATGPFRYASISARLSTDQAWDIADGATGWNGGATGHMTLHNQTTVMLSADLSRSFVPDTTASWQPVLQPGISLYLSTPAAHRLSASAMASWTRSYNWRRGELAPSFTASISLSAAVTDRLALQVDFNPTAEFNPDGGLDFTRGVTTVWRPALTYAVTPKMNTRITLELVNGWNPDQDRREHGEYVAALWSWTFRPRSTVYFAWNFTSDPERASSQVQVIKLRYLFVF